MEEEEETWRAGNRKFIVLLQRTEFVYSSLHLLSQKANRPTVRRFETQCVAQRFSRLENKAISPRTDETHPCRDEIAIRMIVIMKHLQNKS